MKSSLRDKKDGPLGAANDLQVVGDRIFVSRFDPLGSLPFRSEDWKGIAEVQDGRLVREREQAFPGANGIVDLGQGRDLVVADYWNKRLRFVKKDGEEGKETRFASAELPIRPDNLTLDVDQNRILIAGQRNFFLTALNLLFPSLPSPSAVIEIKTESLDATAKGDLLWSGGLSYGRSVSVAIPVLPGSDNLILGQIRAPDLLHVVCKPGT